MFRWGRQRRTYGYSRPSNPMERRVRLMMQIGNLLMRVLSMFRRRGR